MSAIFISHSSKDGAVAAELKTWLGERGFRSLFLDFDPELGIPAGRNWEQELYRQLRACQAVIVLCSAHSMSSDWCFVEITHARALGKHIFPLRVAPCSVRPPLDELQVIDATASREDAYARLVQGLGRAGLENLFPWDERRPPYPGLMAFQEADAAVFFGREPDIRAGLDALNRLRRFGGARLLIYLGASGSGKSSLLRAGVLPRLKQNPENWLVVPVFRPLQRPRDEMALALAAVRPQGAPPRDWKTIAADLDGVVDAPDASAAAARLLRDLRQAGGNGGAATVVLPIDQFEEALVATGEAARFLRLVAAIVADPERQAVVLATLRSDFLAALQTNPAFQSSGFDTLSVSHLSVDGLVQVIEGPAQVAGLEVETGLTRLMLEDVETEDSLPLLAFTLRELWEHDRRERRLGVATYRDVLGGVHGAVARAAEAVLAAQPLTAEQEEDLRSAFLAMVRLGETGQYTRQPVRWRDLPARAAPLLERFVAARLLVSGSENDERVLEVAHEALFRVWTRAKNWLDADRDNLRLREGIRQAAREWSERGSAPELLVHRGGRLEAAEVLAQQRRFPLEPVQRDYVQACIDAREAERAAEQRRIAARRRRVQITIASLSLGLVVVSALGLWALRERRQATDRLASLHWVNAVTELERADDLKASHHFMQVFALSTDAADARNALLAGELLSGNAVLAAILQPPGGIEAAAFARGSDRVVTWSAAGTARVWDLRTGGFAEAPLHEGAARKVVASPLGKRVVLWFGDDAIEVRDSDTGRSLATASGAGGLPVFSGSETRFAIREEDVVRVWDEARGEPVAVLKHPDRVRGVVLSAQGERALTWDAKGIARLWNPDSGEKLAEVAHGGEVSAAVIGNDLQQLLLWGKDGPLTLWRAAGLAPLELGSSGATNPSIMGAAFFANGKRILTWNHGGAGIARIFDAETGKEVARLRHRQAVRNAVFDRAQSLVLTWSDDGTARVWNSADGKLRSVLRHDDEVRGAAFSADDTRILTWSNDGNARVWDAASGQPLSLGLRHDGPVRGAAFGPDGHSILSFDERSARLWQQRPDRERRIGTLDHAEGVLSAGFAAGAGDVLTLTRDGRLHRWAGGERKPTALALPRRLAGGAFDGGGERVVGWGADHVIGIWSTDDGRGLAAPMRHERSDLGILGAAFSGDGSRVVSWGDDKTARVWDAGTGKLLALLRHPSTVSGAVSSRDQTRIVTWSIDRIVRLWDVGDQALVRSLPAHEYGVQGAALSGDNARIMTWDAGGTVRLWDARSGGALKHYRDGAGGPVRGALWSGDEGRILTWDERTVGIRDSRREGKPGERIVWEAGNVLEASFNADERIVLTTGDDGARLWNARSGQPLTRWMTVPGSMQGAALRRDEGVLLAWSDQTVRTWNVAVGEGLAGEAAVAMQQARTGTRLGSVGQVELIPPEEWRALRDHHLEPGRPGR